MPAKSDGSPWIKSKKSCVETRTSVYALFCAISMKDFFDFIQGDPSLLAASPRLRAWRPTEGVPIKVDGEIVGAIG